jgi:DNA-binding transcriptional ArsR family regulator
MSNDHAPRKKKNPPHKLNWYAKVFIFEMVSHPAYRNLSKSATDVLTVAIAKSDAAAATKDRKPGRPVFAYTYSEADRVLNMPAETFNTAWRKLEEVGFVRVNRPGGIQDGDGIPTLYQLDDRWKTWIPPARDNTNILKARAAKKAKKESREASAGTINPICQNLPHPASQTLSHEPGGVWHSI